MTSISQSPHITRIDLKDFPNEPGIRVEKWADGWNAETRPIQISNQIDLNFEEMVSWLQDNGWDVVTWPADKWLGVPKGARAFKGLRRSVRTKYQMKKRRSELVKKMNDFFRRPDYREIWAKTPPEALVGKVHAIDLAYET